MSKADTHSNRYIKRKSFLINSVKYSRADCLVCSQFSTSLPDSASINNQLCLEGRYTSVAKEKKEEYFKAKYMLSQTLEFHTYLSGVKINSCRKRVLFLQGRKEGLSLC